MAAPLKKKGERSVFGVGYKSPTTKVYLFKDGVMTWKCPYYSLWTSILRRCYSKVYLKNNPTYTGCSVSEVWHNFDIFKQWVKGNPNLMGFLDKSLDLDKDFLSDTKVYGPKTCVFIPGWINSLLNDRGGDEKLPLGVYFHKGSGKYRAQISYRGKREHLGYHDTAISAHQSWQKRKAEILLLARKEYLLGPYQDSRVAKAIKLFARKILEDVAVGNVTHKTLRHDGSTKKEI